MIDLSDTLEVIAKTDTGQKRIHNEDSIGADSACGLVLVADGMGGHNAGEVASGIATSTIYAHMQKALPKIEVDKVDEKTGYALGSIALKEAVEFANQEIYDAAQKNSEYAGMGTTIVVALFYDNRMSIAHVGDSRVYRLRDERLNQVTKDHSLAQELVDKGFYECVAEAQTAGNKNLVTRALGVEGTILVELHEEVVRPEDIYLLCSDGLTDMVSDEKIYLTLNEFRANLNKATEKLIEAANKNGGEDNISVVLVKPTKSFGYKKGWYDNLFSIA